MSAPNPPCQTQGCSTRATVLLQSKMTGSELHLCAGCASEYHEQGWRKVTGSVELRSDAGDGRA